MHGPTITLPMHSNAIAKHITTAPGTAPRWPRPVAAATVSHACHGCHQFRSILAPFREIPPASNTMVEPLLDSVIALALIVMEDPPILIR